MTVTYIGHSGFLLETEDAYFLFDYFKGTIPELKNNKSIIVFSSHRHHDHFNPEIFELIKIYPDIRYVLSYDIPLKRHLKKYENQGIDLAKNILITKKNIETMLKLPNGCLLYTSDAADDMQCVDLGGRRIIKKKFFQAEDGIRDFCLSRGLGDVYKRQGIDVINPSV